MCHPSVTRQALRAGILMMLILLVMSCGGGPAKEKARARKLPKAIDVKCFPDGEYVSTAQLGRSSPCSWSRRRAGGAQ
jgi:hypothetical protein